MEKQKLDMEQAWAKEREAFMEEFLALHTDFTRRLAEEQDEAKHRLMALKKDVERRMVGEKVDAPQIMLELRAEREGRLAEVGTESQTSALKDALVAARWPEDEGCIAR